MIAPENIAGVPEGTARRIIAEARSIAPCLDSLADDPRLDAIAILQGVAQELIARSGQLHIKRQRIGPAEIDYYDVSSAFGTGDRAALRALCRATSDPAPGAPVGSFPIDDPFRRIWPERTDYS